MKVCFRYALACATLMGLPFLGGCAQEPKIIRETVPVISSKPYRYLKISPKDELTKGTLLQISRHNQVHWKVKQAEAKTKANAKGK